LLRSFIQATSGLGKPGRQLLTYPYAFLQSQLIKPARRGLIPGRARRLLGGGANGHRVSE